MVPLQQGTGEGKQDIYLHSIRPTKHEHKHDMGNING